MSRPRSSTFLQLSQQFPAIVAIRKFLTRNNPAQVKAVVQKADTNLIEFQGRCVRHDGRSYLINDKNDQRGTRREMLFAIGTTGLPDQVLALIDWSSRQEIESTVGNIFKKTNPDHIEYLVFASFITWYTPPTIVEDGQEECLFGEKVKSGLLMIIYPKPKDQKWME